MDRKIHTRHAFTLIELSITLVIIGLIVGGIVVGRDLIGAAAIRAQITQIQKFNQATNTFYGKYGFLPGDIPAGPAAMFNFVARGTGSGQGDGNGIIEGYSNVGSGVNGGCVAGVGEPGVFWEDLSSANLIDGSFTLASSTNAPASNLTLNGTPSLSAYMPQAKIRNNFVYVWSGGTGVQNSSNYDTNNYFGLSAATGTYNFSSSSYLESKPGLTVNEAAAIDAKIDDGVPQVGRVMSVYLDINVPWTGCSAWAAGGNDYGASSGGPDYAPSTAATSGSATTCYDNSNVAGQPQHYSVTQNGGAGVNCSLSFRF